MAQLGVPSQHPLLGCVLGDTAVSPLALGGGSITVGVTQQSQPGAPGLQVHPWSRQRSSLQDAIMLIVDG